MISYCYLNRGTFTNTKNAKTILYSDFHNAIHQEVLATEIWVATQGWGIPALDDRPGKSV